MMKKLFKPFYFTLILVLVALIGFVDFKTGYIVSLMFLYIIPVTFAARYMGIGYGILTAVLSGITWLMADLASGRPYSNMMESFWNMFVRIFFFLLPVYIIERRQREKMLRESEAWLSVTLKSIGDAVIATDMKGHITLINPVASTLTGREQKEAVGRPLEEIFNIINEKTGERAENPVARVIREGMVVGLANHTVLIRKDGERLPIDDSAAPIKNEEGELIGVVLIFRDVSEQRQARRALEASEESYRGIFESLNDAILIRDINTYDIVSVNNKACEMFCYPKEEMTGLKFGAVSADSPPHSPVRLKELFDKAANDEQQLFEWLARDKFGREFWVEINVKRAIIEGQYRLLCVARDITERKQLLEQRNDFINMVSHELRTPLSAIKESISIIGESGIGSLNEKQQKILNIGKNNIDRLTRLINHVLDFQKIDAGRMEFRFEENDVNNVIKEVYGSMSPSVIKKGLKFTLKLDNKLPRIKFDEDRIVEVLTNIIDNAVKFTEKGGIAVITALGDNFIQVSVEDTGGGIKEDDMPKLFQRFAQLKRKEGGTGLGLAISKEIIERHKGRIWAESEFGKGTVFHFILPIRERRK